MGLFRDEALQAQRQPLLGTIVLHSNHWFWALSLAVLALVVGLLLLLTIGEYTRRATLNGYVVPDRGVARVHAPTAGIVAEVMAHEGETVTQGQGLLRITSERHRPDQPETSAALQTKTEERMRNLRQVMEQQQQLFAQGRSATRRRLESLQHEHAQIETEKLTQQRLLSYAQATQQRFDALANSGFVSNVTAQEKSEAAIAQMARLQALARTATGLEREIAAVRAELSALPMREQTQLAELSRALTSTEQELIELDSRREGLVVAPRDGTVSGLTVQAGQTTAPERPLMTLVPPRAELEVHLFAPSKDAGFVRPGQTVLIRFHAFPYQKFGHYKGTVADVSGTPLMASELIYPVTPQADTSSLLPALPTMSSIDPMYRIRVHLDKNHAMAYGQQQHLQPGMQLQADVMLDTRTLLEWVLEPIYSLRGKYLE